MRQTEVWVRRHWRRVTEETRATIRKALATESRADIRHVAEQLESQGLYNDAEEWRKWDLHLRRDDDPARLVLEHCRRAQRVLSDSREDEDMIARIVEGGVALGGDVENWVKKLRVDLDDRELNVVEEATSALHRAVLGHLNATTLVEAAEILEERRAFRAALGVWTRLCLCDGVPLERMLLCLTRDKANALLKRASQWLAEHPRENPHLETGCEALDSLLDTANEFLLEEFLKRIGDVLPP